MLLELARLLAESQIRFFTVFEYITLRALLACATALAIGLLAGPWVIRRLTAMKNCQASRSYCPGTHPGKGGTPTMGGVVVPILVTINTFLWADLTNCFVWVVFLVTLGFWLIRWGDYYRKVV